MRFQRSGSLVKKDKKLYALYDPLINFCYVNKIPIIGVDSPGPNRCSMPTKDRNKYISSAISWECTKLKAKTRKKKLIGVLIAGEGHVEKGLVKDLKAVIGDRLCTHIVTFTDKKVAKEVKKVRRESNEFYRIQRIAKK